MVSRLPRRRWSCVAACLALLAAIAAVPSLARAGTHHAYAPPNVFGPWVQVGAHSGAASFSISASPVGSTAIVGEVRYYGADGRLRIEPFYGPKSIQTCNCYGTVQVRFKGVPLGSAVDVYVNP
jgi:hypothetical protein